MNVVTERYYFYVFSFKAAAHHQGVVRFSVQREQSMVPYLPIKADSLVSLQKKQFNFVWVGAVVIRRTDSDQAPFSFHGDENLRSE